MERLKCEDCDHVFNCRISSDCIINDDKQICEQTIEHAANNKSFNKEQLPIDLWHDTINLAKGCYVNNETGEMLWDIEAVCSELGFEDTDWALSQLFPDEVEEWDNNGEKRYSDRYFSVILFNFALKENNWHAVSKVDNWIGSTKNFLRKD